MNDHLFDTLVRTIDPATFSQAAHGAGHRVVHAGKGKVTLYEPRLWDRLRSRRDEQHYFVKTLATPLVLDDWAFRWSEGTSAISLDFVATFQIQANEDHHARHLVEALHGPEGPAQALRALVDRHLHEAMARQLLECKREGRNLLAIFRTSSVGVGESEALNQEVSDKVREALGGLPFRIGLRLRNSPPMQVEVRQEDVFTLADSASARTVVTTALLELDNYQTYKKTGLETDAAIREAISHSIRQAVKRHLFAQKYYAIVRSFASGADSIERQMRAHIADDAARIGYRLNMFQAFPDIAALSLIEGTRVDLPADDFKYRPENSAGHVQMGIALTVRAGDFGLLDRLIPPDAPDIRVPIRKQVHQICQDRIRHVSRMDFNLRFNETVAPRLTQDIVAGLRAYGLESDVIFITQSPTEEAARFGAICGQTTPFSVTIPAHAEAGDADDVVIEGRVEVTGMAEDGWERFVRKDHGYRADSQWSEPKLRARARELGVAFDDAQPVGEAMRRHLAIELELAAIRAGVVDAVKEGLATHAELAAQTRTRAGREQLADDVRRLAREAIRREFGLVVDIHGIVRGDTDTEISFAARRRQGHLLIRGRAEQERLLESEKFDACAKGSLESIGEDFAMRKLLQAERGADPAQDLAAIEARLARETGGLSDRRGLTHTGAMEMLAKSAAPARALGGPAAPPALPAEGDGEAPPGGGAGASR